MSMRSGRVIAAIVPLGVGAFVSAQTVAPSPGSAHAAPGSVLPFDATERTLANGLKVIVVPTGFPNLVSIQIPVQAGSRNEVEPGKSGFAHFFGHLMFRGTPKTPPRPRIRRIGERLGGHGRAERALFR